MNSISKKVAFSVFLIGLLATSSFPAFSASNNPGTVSPKSADESEEVQKKKSIVSSIVKTVISDIKSLGLNETIKKVNSAKLAHGVIIYDFNGEVKTWSSIPSFSGRNIEAASDMTGKKVIRENILKAKGETSGWYRYRLKNPISGMPHNLLVYYQVSDDLIIASGFFE